MDSAKVTNLHLLFRHTNVLLSVVFGLDIQSLGMGFEIVCREWEQYVNTHRVWKLICIRFLRPHPLITTHRPAAEWKSLYRVLPSDICSMIYVPAGIFYNLSKYEDNIIARRSHLPAFWIDEVPVTKVDYRRYTKGLKLQLPSDEKYSYHPATSVTWTEANGFANSYGKQLPTRVQWEKAARGETTRTWPWGNTWDVTKCNCRASKIGCTTPVGKYKNGRSPYGCYDMAGNVFEWLRDDDDSKRFKLNHGASYNRGRCDQTTMCVEKDLADAKMTDVGFRCAFSIPDEMTHLSCQTDASSVASAGTVVVGPWIPGAREKYSLTGTTQTLYTSSSSEDDTGSETTDSDDTD